MCCTVYITSHWGTVLRYHFLPSFLPIKWVGVKKLGTSHDELLAFGMKGKAPACETPVCCQRELSVRIQRLLQLLAQSHSTLMLFSLQELRCYFSVLALQMQAWDCWAKFTHTTLTDASTPTPSRKKTFRHGWMLDGPCLSIAGFLAWYHLQVYWAATLARGWMDGWHCTSLWPVTFYFAKKNNYFFFCINVKQKFAPLCLSSSLISPYSEK